ncbi:MAG: tRNA 2-thiouridine(34) synthase MnmA, partial [Armatimonadetes bacterium]|nr:tRNA 2-thiouridine(34) synthase MnmA [Armatimonadota bacterium]
LRIGGEPLYVIAKDAASNVLIVGPQEALARRQCDLEQVNWVSLAPPRMGAEVPVAVELRYRTEPIPAIVLSTGPTTAHLSLAAHEQAVAPGQSAVFYRGELLLGGGIIAG